MALVSRAVARGALLTGLLLCLAAPFVGGCDGSTDATQLPGIGGAGASDGAGSPSGGSGGMLIETGGTSQGGAGEGGAGGEGGAVPVGCGNGIIEPWVGEACDDGNSESGDGCAGDCTTVEQDYACP